MAPPRYMLDTNICIYIRRKRPAEILKRFECLEPGDAVISTITFGELHFGIEKSVARDRALKLLSELIVLLLTRHRHASAARNRLASAAA